MDDNDENLQTSYRYLFNGRFSVDGLRHRQAHDASAIRGKP
jgi:hypothetical protein